MKFKSKMRSEDYPEGYWERAEGSNYRKYADDPGWSVVWDVMSNHLPAQSDILEVACSKGYFVQEARKRGFNAKGIDISHYAISNPARGVGPHIQQANAVDIPFADDSFDHLFAFEFLEHVYLNEVDQVISEMIRVTRPHGLLIQKIGIAFDDDNPNPHEGTQVMADHGHQNDVTHYNNQVRAWWEAKLQSCGLTRRKDLEDSLDAAFRDRDWSGRFFVYQLGETKCDTSSSQ